MSEIEYVDENFEGVTTQGFTLLAEKVYKIDSLQCTFKNCYNNYYNSSFYACTRKSPGPNDCYLMANNRGPDNKTIELGVFNPNTVGANYKANLKYYKDVTPPPPPAPAFRYFSPRHAHIDAKDVNYRWQNYYASSVRGYTGLDLTLSGRNSVPDVYDPSMNLLDYEIITTTGATPSIELLIYNNSQNAIPMDLTSGNYYRTYVPFGISNTDTYDDKNYTYDPLFWYESPSISHSTINANVSIELVRLKKVYLSNGYTPEYQPLPVSNPILTNIDGYWNTKTETTLEGTWVDDGGKLKFNSTATYHIQPNQLNKIYLKTYFGDWWQMNSSNYVFYMDASPNSPIVDIKITLLAEE